MLEVICFAWIGCWVVAAWRLRVRPFGSFPFSLIARHLSLVTASMALPNRERKCPGCRRREGAAENRPGPASALPPLPPSHRPAESPSG